MATLINSQEKTGNRSFSIKCSQNYSNSSSAEDCEYITYTNVKILVLFAVITSVCVLVNTRIIYVLIINSNRNNRYVNLLVIHFSTIVYLYCDAFLIQTFEKQQVNLFSLAETGFCEMLTFFQSLMYSAFPLNAGALTYERMRAVNKPFAKVHLKQSVAGIWLVSLLTSIPTIFMVKYNKHPLTMFEQCKETLLLKSKDITLAFEWTRFFILFVAVCLYMAYVNYKVWGEVRSFHVLQGNRFRNWKLWPERLQFVFIQSSLFLLIWLLLGTSQFIYRVLCILEEKKTVQYSSVFDFLETCSIFTLLIACPLMYVVMNTEVGPFYLIPQKILGVICRETISTTPALPITTVENSEESWRRIPHEATENEGDGVSIAMNMLGNERACSLRDTATSPITTTLTYNFDRDLSDPICIDCENERNQGVVQVRRKVQFNL